MRKRNKLVCGVGVNDADYQTTITESIDGKQVIVWKCPIYYTWLNMLYRCYRSSKERFPTYVSCSVVKEWHYFMTFKAWMDRQDWEGKELDKDILFPDNKIYGPDTCVFVDKAVNLFMSEKLNTGRELPCGVYKTPNGNYTAKCHDTENKKQKVVGTYPTVEEAYKEFLIEKGKNAKFLASLQPDDRIAKAILNKYKI